MLQNLVEKVKPKHAALAILDPFPSGVAPASGTVDDHALIVPALNRLISAVRAAQVPIIWVLNESSPWFELENWRERRARTGTPATDHHILDGLEPEGTDFTLTKHFYSAFAYSPFDLILRCRGIRTVMLAGGSVLGAVESAAKECFVRGYYVVIARDCVYPVAGTIHETGLDYMALRLGEVATADEIMRCWGVSSAASRS